MRKNHHHLDNHKSKRRKLSPFYKITLSLLLIAFIVLFYFVVLVSTKPKSFPFVTQQINSVLQEKFGENNIALENSYLSFTRYGTLKVAVTSLKILYSAPNNIDKQAFIIPRLEAEFSLFKFLLLSFQPKKIKIIDPNIIVDDLEKFQNLQEVELNSPSHISLIIGLLSSIRKEGSIENFEIENAKLFIKGKEFSTEILLKRSQILTSSKGDVLQISSVNKFSFDKEKNDVDLSSNCQLSKHDGLKCDLFLENFIANSVADLHPSLNILARINARINANLSFALKDGEVNNISFKVKTDKGDFEFLNFFGQKIDFTNFAAAGEYDHKMGILDLSEIETDFISNVDITKKSHLNMSLLVSGLGDEQNKKFDFYIRLQNVLNEELEKFWPVTLHENGVREWVINHTSGGFVKNAYAKFSISQNDEGSHLDSINSEVIFSGFDLEYDKEFPEISNLYGIANFTKDGMKISISDGEVLNSKISEALIEIDSFSAPITMLKISGKTHGSAADGLKHVNHGSDFANEIEKYLNGNSQNNFDIRLPLGENLTLKNSYIAVNSTITGLNNDYVQGGVMINSKKDFKSTNFVTSIDFTAAELVAKAFDITKQLNVESGLDFIVSVKDPQKILIKNISLWKKEMVEEQKQRKNSTKQEPKFNIAKITGNIGFETSPFGLTSVVLKNDNFGKNDYVFSYLADNKTSVRKISLKGKEINLGSFVENKFFPTSASNDNIATTQIQIAADRVDLVHKKFLKSFYLAASCYKGMCYNGLVKAGYGKQQFLNLRASKRAKDNYALVEGNISDVGYLAEALGISNIVSAGNAQVKLWNKTSDQKPALEGRITIDNSITIYENTTVKRLAKDTLFSQIKDKIFSSEKTTFDSVKVEFDIDGSNLNIKSLIANNYKIGVTAKGVINLKNDTYELRGMIIPGFLINNLFGIGNIPILGNVISGILTGGEGGGLFGLSYKYTKTKNDKEGKFETNKVAAFVPSTIQNLFD